MAVEPWDVEAQPEKSRPALHLVPPSPERRGLPIRAGVLILTLAGLIGLPVVRAEAPGPSVPGLPPGGLSATQISSLDPMAPAPGGKRPRSARPAGGIAFVRCTRLWAANPDGRRERVILDMRGISSPTFSPDARTIAFVSKGREIWLVGADGSDAMKVGELAQNGTPIGATAAGLTWSPDGSNLAFSLVTPGSHLASTLLNSGADVWSEGSAIWRLRLATGKLTREGSGWPAPFWTDKGLWTATWQRDSAGFTRLYGIEAGLARKMSSAHEDLSAAAVHRWLLPRRRPGFVSLLRRGDGTVVLSVRRNAGAADEARVAPPDGYQISARRAPALSQDGEAVLVNLIDSQGGTDVGLFDLGTRTWRILDDAWDASASPAPTHRGSLSARRAMVVARDLVGRWSRRHGRRATLLAGARIDDDLFPATGWVDHQIGDPVRPESEEAQRPSGWDVPTTLLGRTSEGFAARHLIVEVRNNKGRLRARPRPASPLMRIETVADAFSFLSRVLPVEIAVPSYLPEGARLARDPVSAWRWRAAAQGSVHLEMPGRGWVTVSYGNVSLNMGCGGTNEPEETTVEGVPAVSDSLGDRLDDMRQVIWPATLGRQDTARFNVVGTRLPMEEVERIAASIQRARR